MANRKNGDLPKNSMRTNTDIQQASGNVLSTETTASPAEPAPVTVAIERGSIKLRKDLLLRGEAPKIKLKQKGVNINLTDIVEKALEKYLDEVELYITSRLRMFLSYVSEV